MYSQCRGVQRYIKFIRRVVSTFQQPYVLVLSWDPCVQPKRVLSKEWYVVVPHLRWRGKYDMRLRVVRETFFQFSGRWGSHLEVEKEYVVTPPFTSSYQFYRRTLESTFVIDPISSFGSDYFPCEVVRLCYCWLNIYGLLYRNFIYFVMSSNYFSVSVTFKNCVKRVFGFPVRLFLFINNKPSKFTILIVRLLIFITSFNRTMT